MTQGIDEVFWYFSFSGSNQVALSTTLTWPNREQIGAKVIIISFY